MELFVIWQKVSFGWGRTAIAADGLRHSCTTTHLESGTDLRFIRKLLGRISSKATGTHTEDSTKSLQNLKSPFDDLWKKVHQAS